MSYFSKILKKELKDSFTHSSTYAVISLFLLISGLMFFNLLYELVNLSKTFEHLGRNQFDFTIELFRKTYGNINFLLLLFTPVFTLTTFAPEYENGTIFLLLKSKLSPWNIVFAKFLRLFLTVSVLLIISLCFAFMIFLSGYSNWLILLNCIFAVLLNVLIMSSLAVFISSIVEGKITSVLVSLTVFFMLWLLGFFSQSVTNPLLSQIMSFLSFSMHFQSIMSGKLYLSSFTYYFSFSTFFLYLAKVCLISRQWR